MADNKSLQALLDRVLSHLSTALDDLESSPDRRPEGQVRIAMDDLREIHAVLAAPAQEVGPAVETYPGDYVLPCDVRVSPATTITRGCTLKTLMQSISLREATDHEFDVDKEIDLSTQWINDLRAEAKKAAMKDVFWLSRDQVFELIGDGTGTRRPTPPELVVTQPQVQEAEPASCREDDGCPTEGAVLRREWRAMRWALAEYPKRNTHQLQARKVCAGVLKLAQQESGDGN